MYLQSLKQTVPVAPALLAAAAAAEALLDALAAAAAAAEAPGFPAGQRVGFPDLEMLFQTTYHDTCLTFTVI